MERIGIDTLHKLFYEHPPKKGGALLYLKQIDPCSHIGNKGLSYCFGFAHLGNLPI